jgi:hypothetical protein
VPAGIGLAMRLIPTDLRDELRLVAAQTPWPGPARAAAVAVAVFWTVCAVTIVLAILR